MMKQRILSLLAAALLILAFPASVWADDNSGAGTSSTSSNSSNQHPPLKADPENPVTSLTCDSKDYSKLTGILEPTGAAAHTYTYNYDTCLWENDYYTWSPVTKDYTAKYSTDYTYNSITGKYETTRWVYNTAKDKWESITISVDPSNLASGADPSSKPQTPSGNSPAISSPTTTTGPGSNSTQSNSANNNLTVNSNFNVKLTNDITQTAISGDVAALQNTWVGNIKSGNTSDIVNILNMLQSSWDIQGAGDLMTFVANINGNVTGDLVINPGGITGPGSTSVNQSNVNNNVTINTKDSGTINNNVDLNSNSGNVNVNSNTLAGDATSGNAEAIANLVNMIDSAIMAGKSFIGVININGNLDGDILLPPNFLDMLIASGAPSATITISRASTTNVNVNANSSQTINNDVSLNAQSGNVNADSNTTAGSMTSGNAVTRLTIFNLTGRQVTGANSLLVFVNVLGSWVGMILDAPGANSAVFCGGACTTSTNVNTNANLTSDTSQTINNNLKLNAQSGNVDASKNTEVGNGRSGDASASANILNIENSKLSLSNWFGILFINVLGQWHGSFGMDTAAGEPTVSGGMGGGSGSTTPQVFKFVAPRTDGTTASINRAAGQLIDSANQQSQSSNNPLGVIAGTSSHGPKGGAPAVARSSKWVIPIVSTAVGMLLLSAEQLTRLGRKHKVGNQVKNGFGQVAHSLRILLL